MSRDSEFPRRTGPGAFERYAAALGAFAVALLIRLSLDPVMASRTPFPTFFGAVVVAGWFGGRGPGVLVVGLSLLTSWYRYTEPVNASLDGISGCKGPQGPLAGVFLDDSIPNSGRPPDTLHFTPAGPGVEFATLSPELRQVF